MYDPDREAFRPVELPVPDKCTVFGIGERFTIKGIEMRIKKITSRDIVLRPLGKKFLDGRSMVVAKEPAIIKAAKQSTAEPGAPGQ